LLGVVQFTGAASVVSQYAVDIIEGLLEHWARWLVWASGSVLSTEIHRVPVVIAGNVERSAQHVDYPEIGRYPVWLLVSRLVDLLRWKSDAVEAFGFGGRAPT
jgi:hypothetical protein